MAEDNCNDLRTEVALLKQANENQNKVIDKQDALLMSMITTVQDLRTKFYLLGVGFPTLISLLGLMKAFGVFGK